MKSSLKICSIVALLFATSVRAADESEDKKNAWDVAAPPGERRDIPIDTRTGTWLSVDVSPDGKRVAFDLLGDIYDVPIGGGEARALASGMAWDMQPRYSPDGKSIAFTSDRGGGDNLWIMDANGGAARQISKESFRLLNNPAWHPNGRYIVGRKHFTTRRSLGTGELWLYNLDGGEGVQLVKRPNDEFQKELGEPEFSPDGKYLYYSQNVTPGNTFEYAQDVNRAVFSIRRYEVATGETDDAVSEPGGGVRPTPSPDGRWLAFVHRVRTPEKFETALFLKDLASGQERPLYTDLDRDMQETWAINGLYPNMDWTPDSRSVVFWAGGGIKRIDVASGAVSDIPFHVKDSRIAMQPPRLDIAVAPDEIQSHMARFASVSPDGQQVVFESFGRLWVRSVSSGTPRRLTRDEARAFELFPSWSRDGKRIVFVRWTDAGLGEVHVVAAGGGASRAVSRQPGHYLHPRFSPDGKSIVVERSTGGTLTAPLWSKEPGIYRIAVEGGAAVRLTDDGRDPHFVGNDGRIYFTQDKSPPRESEPAHELVSVDANGEDRHVHARSSYVSNMEVSPTGEWLAFIENYHVYVVPMPPGGQIDLSLQTKAVPQRRASDIGGTYINWIDGDTLSWTLGASLYRADMSELFASGATAEEAQQRHGRTVANLSITRPADKPRSVIALTGARIITMNGSRQVIENGTILVRENRIVGVGAGDAVQIPADAQRLDLAGRTVMPGIIDAHAHGPQGVTDIIPQQNWSTLAHLALGVTTVHDPSNNATEVFAASEYQRAGEILAPRIFSTGDVVYGAHSEGYSSIDKLEDARNHVQRLKAQGAISIKNYNQPRREQRQMVTTAAREAGMLVVCEGGSLYHMDMSMVADGNTSIEHNVPPERFYDDVMQFWPSTGVAYTPTLVVTYGGPGSEHFFYQESEVWQHPILSRYVPPHILQPRSVRRQMAPQSDYQAFRDSAANAKRLLDKGVLVNTGAHGQREGLGSHWEIWAFVQGGMSPMQALQAATIDPAQHLGMARDLGSIETGKLADLLIVDGNPLEDIRVTDRVAYVVLNGRVYQGGTLAEQLSGQRKLEPFYWSR
ncbi:MAG TPA: amidohydrolase family protein [Steroidobacteraceae bacterium]|nr:amidohydrolase family protein [Steroidobacteraceae bacterium]